MPYFLFGLCRGGHWPSVTSRFGNSRTRNARPYEGNSDWRMEVGGRRVLRLRCFAARSGRRVLCLSFSAELVGRGLAPAVQDVVGTRIGLRRIPTGYRSGGTKAPPYAQMGIGVWNSGIVNDSPGGSCAGRRWHRRRCPGWQGSAAHWTPRGRGSGPCGGGCLPEGGGLLC